MKRRLILLAIPFCILMLCGMIPQKAMTESVSLVTGSNSSTLATDSNPEEPIYTISGFFKQLYPHWKKTIILEPEEDLELSQLPARILYMSDDGSIPLEIDWDLSSADLTEPGLHYISGTPVLPSDYIFAEEFDGTAYWPVFRTGDGAVLPVTPEEPEIYDTLIELGGNPETELRIVASNQQYYVGEDGYVDAARAPVWQWDYSKVDIHTPGRYRISGVPSFPDGYALVEGYKKEFTVFVLPTDRIELFAATEVSGRGSRLYLDWIYKNQNYQTSVLEIETSEGNWEACDPSWYACRSTYLALHINLFPKDTPISIRLRYQDMVDGETVERVTEPVVVTIPSNIQELYDSIQLDSSSIAELVNGDRDGGDSGGSELPDIEQPMPEVPDDGDGTDDGTDDGTNDIPDDPMSGGSPGETEIPDSTPPESEPDKTPDQELHQNTAPETTQPVYEIVTDSYTSISGLRLKALTTLGPTVLFEKQGVSVEIPSELLNQLQLGDYDLFEITIQHPQKNAFQIDAQINGIPLETLDGTQVYLPRESEESYRYEVRDSDGIVLSETIYKEEQGLLCVVIDRPGVYFLTEINEPTQPQTSLAKEYIPKQNVSATIETESESVPTETSPTMTETESESVPTETSPTMTEAETETESESASAEFSSTTTESKSEPAPTLWLLPVVLLLGGIFLILRRWKYHD